jgi:protein-S-isoprenylcysteine O-methyltransferase Ste14
MATVLRILIFVVLGWVGFQILLVGFISRIKSFGKPPISWPALFLAKTAVGVSFGLMFWAAAAADTRLSPWFTGLFLALLLGGILFFTPALFGLGRNLRVGLPHEETVLVTSGIYQVSRNPIYAGIFCFMGASLIYAFSWVNLVAVAVGVILHHRIVLAEEKFLAGQFKDYEVYRRRVRRYL